MEYRPEKQCLIGTKLKEPCPKNCKSVVSSNSWAKFTLSSCIAVDKLEAFLESRTTLNTAMTAFQQAHFTIIEEFLNSSDAALDLIRYFLSISSSNQVVELIENLTNPTLYRIVKMEFENYQKIEIDLKSKKRRHPFFELKSNAYWQKVSFLKICELLVYIIREKKDYAFAAQFLTLLPTGVVSDLQKFTGLSLEEEKELYLSLKDAIYELPIQNPRIYDHMMQLFADDPEIYLILSTMEELVKRQKQIAEITDQLVEYYEKHNFELSIQSIYSELYGMPIELVFEVLNALREKQIITESHKNVILELMEKKSIDLIGELRYELKQQP